jgi:DNA-binding MarR family transcriptional regulator
MQQINASGSKPLARAPGGRTAAARPERITPPADWAQAELRPLPGLAYGVLDELLGYALRRAQNALYLHFQRSVDRADVSPQRFAALVLVAQNPGLRQGLLAEAMGLHRSGGMRLVDWLCAQGWVQRADDPLDRRSWTVPSTPAGLAPLQRVTAQVRAHDAALLAALGDEGPQLRGLLDRLAATADALATPIPPSG